MTGPLASMFGYLYDQNRPRRVDALRAELSKGDDMGPIILDPEHRSPIPGPYTGLLDIIDARMRPGRGPMPFRPPGQEVSAPPVSPPLASMFKR